MVSTKPGRGRIERCDWGKKILHGQMRILSMRKGRLEPAHMFFFSSLLSLSTLDADVVHSMFYTDAWAASLARRWKRRKYKTIFQINGPPVPSAYYWKFPPDAWMLGQAIRHADQRIVQSVFCQRLLNQHYGLDAQVIPIPIDLQAFPLRTSAKSERPIILSLASFDERRKGVRVLVKAFEQVKAKIPHAVLWLSGHISPAVKAEVLSSVRDSVRSDIKILGVGEMGDVPRLYREASVTVVPSMWESYGMVVVESWACGTPVVVANQGGLAELVDDPSLGVVFDPQTDGFETMNVAGLTEAMLAGLALAEKEETRHRCRARAQQYSWEVWGAKIENLYDT